MSVPTVSSPRLVAADIHMIGAELPIPGLGVLPANAFVIHGPETILVDTGVVALADPFFEQLCTVVDPTRIAYVWLTHADADHVGCLDRILALSPGARVITNFLGMGKLGLRAPISKDRVLLVNAGQSVTVAGRELHAIAPIACDAPETQCVFDSQTRTLFSADCFGALLSEVTETAQELPRAVLAEGMGVWTQVDVPWIGDLDETSFGRALSRFERLEAHTVLSSHLPPATGMTHALLADLVQARRAPRFVGPDEAALVAAAVHT